MDRNNNHEIRQALKDHGMKQWELGEIIGVTETTICRWLRKEITDERKDLILTAIKGKEL